MVKPDWCPYNIWAETIPIASVDDIEPKRFQRLRENIARALIAAEQRGRNAERYIWQPAIEYFDRYCVDEAECTSICIDDEQHDRAKAFAAVVSRAKAEAEAVK